MLAREAELADRGLDARATLAPAPVAGDPRLIERLIANLIDNAIRHNTPGGHVEIATGTRDRRAFVSDQRTPARPSRLRKSSVSSNPSNGSAAPVPDTTADTDSDSRSSTRSPTRTAPSSAHARDRRADSRSRSRSHWPAGPASRSTGLAAGETGLEPRLTPNEASWRYESVVSASGRHEPVLVGEHDDLDAIAQPELGQDPSDVGLDRRL